MIEFIFYNAVLAVLIYLIVKSQHFLVVSSSYLIILYTLLNRVIAKSYPIKERLANITVTDTTNTTALHEYAYDYVTISQGYTDFVYTALLAVVTLYYADRTSLGMISKKMSGWLKWLKD